MIKRFVKTSKKIVELDSFRSTTAINIANDASLAFSAILMIMWNIPETTILWVFCTYFFLSSVMLKLTTGIRPRYLFILLAISMGLCIAFARDNGQVFIPIMLIIMMTLLDLLKINLVHDLKVLSDKTGDSYTTIISVNSMLALFFAGVSLPLFGYIGGFGSSVLFSVLLVIVLYSYRLGRNVKPSHAKDGSAFKVKLSYEIKIMAFLSFSMSSVAFLSRRFVLPVLVMKISQHLGMEDRALYIFGTVMGFVALFTMLLRGRNSGSESTGFMFRSYYFVLIGWALISGILMMNEIKTSYIVFACFLVLWVDYYARIWSITFVSYSSLIADKDNMSSFNPSRLMGYMSVQTIYKSIGSAFGFAVAALLYNYIDLGSILLSMCIISLLVGLFSHSLMKKKMDVSA